MSKGRLEAFSDGVIAILITIMVLDLHIPNGSDFDAIRPVVPVLLVYALSFVNLGIYWNNHHHMLAVVDRVSGGMLWANLTLLFWLSLVPFTMGWMAYNSFAALPTACYGAVLLMAALSYFALLRITLRTQGPGSRLANAVGRDYKGRGSVLLYIAGVPLAFVQHWVALGLYVAVALLWLVPDPRIERAMG